MNILVTGGNKGIGFEICRQLARGGHHVILSARSAERGEKAVKALAAEGLKVDFLLLDTGDDSSIQRAAGRPNRTPQARRSSRMNAAFGTGPGETMFTGPDISGCSMSHPIAATKSSS